MTRISAVLFLLTAFLTGSCNPFADDNISGESYSLISQDSSRVTFPGDFKEEVMLVGYIYTSCPDICPVTTTNMLRVQQEFDRTAPVRFISISFDPERDTPKRLREYAQNYSLESPPWYLLTGEEAEIDSVMKRLNIDVQKSFTNFREDGDSYYFMDHTDRVTLIGPEGRIYNTYVGSEADPEEIKKDIEKLLEGIV